MNRYFLQLWARSQNNWLAAKDVKRGDLLDHTASNQFGQKHINQGDFIYVVTVEERELYLIGRIKVRKICSQTEAHRILGRRDLWEAENHALAEPGSELPMHNDLIVPPQIAENLTFLTKEGYTILGDVDGRKLQTIRELTPESAYKLDGLLESKHL